MLAAPVVLIGQEVQPPAGWALSNDTDKQVYRPKGLAGTDSFALTIDRPASVSDGDMRKWFLDQVKSDAAKRGAFEETEPLRSGPLGILSLERVYKKGARVWDVVYIAFPLADQRALFCSTAADMRDLTAYREYVHAAGKICGQTARSIDKATSTNK
jgi:hypothetical protein